MATETSLVLAKKQETSVEKGKELLTIRQMVERGFSQSLSVIYGIFACFLFDTSLTSCQLNYMPFFLHRINA